MLGENWKRRQARRKRLNRRLHDKTDGAAGDRLDGFQILKIAMEDWIVAAGFFIQVIREDHVFCCQGLTIVKGYALANTEDPLPAFFQFNGKVSKTILQVAVPIDMQQAFTVYLIRDLTLDA